MPCCCGGAKCSHLLTSCRRDWVTSMQVSAHPSYRELSLARALMGERKQSAGGARFSPRFPQGYGAVALLSVFSALVGKEGFEPLLSAVLLSVFGMMGGLVWRSFTTTFDESARYITNSIRWRRQEAAFLVCHFLSPVCVSSARCFYFMKLQARPHERP